MLLAQPIRTFDHEAHDLVRCIDDSETICGLLVVDLVEVFVDDFQKRLLFMMAGYKRCRTPDGGVIRAETRLSEQKGRFPECFQFEAADGLADR